MSENGQARAASKGDALALAELINMAGEGMPVYLWEKQLEPGQTVWDIGKQRARREKGAFSFRNTTVMEVNGAVVACLVGYAIEADPEPLDYDDTPPMFVPLLELEHAAPSTWYVNVLATYPEHRGNQHGTALLSKAEEFARRAGLCGTSLIVADANTDAQRLYERVGYRAGLSRPMVKEAWENPSKNWILMTKEF